MRALLKILTRESLVSFVALIVLLLLVWFGGEFLHAKYGVFERTTRILVMAVVLALWFLLYIVQKVFAIRGAMQIEKRLRAQAADQRESVRPDKKPEVEALEKQLTEAIQALKASTFGKEALYALPWYIIVGPPGVGKTTALVESGLSFPHMSQGRRGIRGVGGTRNCDWWFTDQGILLDTAGRYTTELEDRDEWLAFLEMLRKSRKWKPINGAIVAVSVPELLRMTAEDLTTHAKNIRDRIDELTRSLELVFPVYLIFTKCDLLSGFTEFFEGFSKADRAQAWGATLPYGIPSDIGAVFEEEVKKLYAALCARRVKALSADLPHEKRRQIYSFPLQFAVAERRLQEFTAELFRSNPYQESSILRGFYFTSGTQEGAPIDQVVAAMSQAFGLKEEAGSLAKQVTEKKSYFLHDLFTKIIFPDQNLARSSTRVQKRTRLIGRGIAVGATAAFVMVFILLFLSFSTNYSRISAVSGASTKLKDQSWDGPGGLDSKLEALDELKNGLERIERAETSWIAAPWLFNHGRQVSRTARDTLLTRLTSLFAAPSARILAAELKDGLEKPKSAIEDFESLHGLLRAYLTLSGRNVSLSPLELQATLDRNYRWRRALGDANLSEKEEVRSDGLLKFYAAQIGRRDLPPVPYDKDLVAAVTNDLAGPGWVHAVYQRIVKNPQAGDLLRKMSPDDFLTRGPQKALLFCPEAFQVEGIYTKKGYNEWVRGAVERESHALAAKLETVEGAPHDPQPIREELEKTYAAECDRRWLDFLKHTDPKDSANLNDALRFLGQVIHPDTSPFREVIAGIQSFRRIDLKHATTSASTAEGLGAADGGARPPGSAPPDPKEEWDWLQKTFDAVAKLRETAHRILRSSPDSGQFINLKLESLNELKKAFEDARTAVRKEVQLSDKALEGAAFEALYKLLESTSLAVRKECQKEADEFWKGTVVTPFREGFAPKYPFADGATEEVSMGAFSKIFQPVKGVFWTTLENLKRLNGIEIYGSRLTSFSGTFQATVNKATTFQTALYKPDGSAIEVPIEVALEKTASMADIELRIGKVTFKLLDSPSFRTNLIWSEVSEPPGAPPGAELRYRVAVAGRIGETKNCLSFPSEWGALRLFRAGKRNPGVTDKFPWEWRCSPENAGETIHYDLVLIRRDANPFEPGFFTFDPPERVGS